MPPAIGRGLNTVYNGAFESPRQVADRAWRDGSSLGLSESTITISSFGANSARTWRQAPQGVTPVRLTTAMAVNSFSPAATAAPTATRSAQFVRPNDAFSTFTPW